MKTSELTGSPLDLWVAKAEGRSKAFIDPLKGGAVWDPDCNEAFMPSDEWADGGPIIERERIVLWPTTVFVEPIDPNQLDEERQQWAALHPNSKGLGGWKDGRGERRCDVSRWDARTDSSSRRHASIRGVQIRRHLPRAVSSPKARSQVAAA